jgi:hypothetical protein
MLEIADVSRAIAAYQNGETSLGQFADWLSAVSRRKFAESEEVRAAILELDSLFSEVNYGGMSEVEFREELASAIRPFASQTALVVFDERPRDYRVLAAAAVLAIAFLNVQAQNFAERHGDTSANATVIGSPLNDTGTTSINSPLQVSVQAA